MSDPKKNDEPLADEEFWDLADTFIENADNLCELSHDAGNVSAALLFAASRFSAFVVASSAEDSAELAAKQEEATDYFVDQFRLMLTENLNDFQQNFDEFFAEDETE
ncbi:MAG: DUF3144 domain-containing protein [Planctomycetota bacterium]|nr:DUF3144 domain-containing protein [Planctomycetota bacterium]